MRRDRTKKIANRSTDLPDKKVIEQIGDFFPYVIWFLSFAVVVFWAIAIMCIVFDKVPIL